MPWVAAFSAIALMPLDCEAVLRSFAQVNSSGLNSSGELIGLTLST
jgi:hypothetical protein